MSITTKGLLATPSLYFSNEFIDMFIERNKSTLNCWIEREHCDKPLNNISVGEYRSVVSHYIQGDYPKLDADSGVLTIFGDCVSISLGSNVDDTFLNVVDEHGFIWNLDHTPIIRVTE